jgi:hypothetical protein
VRMLVHQLNGEVSFSNIGGTTACFSFHKHD